MNTDTIELIHDYWFGELDDNGLANPERHSRWFAADSAVDKEISQRFGPGLVRAADGEFDHWSNSDRGLIALVVLLDQFSRNIYRGTDNAFACDDKALALSCQAIASGRHQQLPTIHQVFLYMPLEHSEDLALQEQCVSLFDDLARASGHEQPESFARYACAHRDVIERFGRFPHRNNLLGRNSTPEELDYLDKHGGF